MLRLPFLQDLVIVADIGRSGCTKEQEDIPGTTERWTKGQTLLHVAGTVERPTGTCWS